MSAPSERLVERALTLIVEAEVASDEAAPHARNALHQWRQRSAAHAAAAQEARQRWDALGGMADDLRTHFDGVRLLQPAGPGHRPQRRKLLLGVAGLLGTALVAGRGVQWYWEQPIYRSAFQTQTAQLLKLTLPDGLDGRPGSRLDLAPLSAIDVTLYRQRRIVEMTRGEIRFEVAHQGDRPFRVHTREALIEVVGTAFTVGDRGGPVTVGVEQGHVRVQVRSAPGGISVDAETIDLRVGDLLEIRDGRANAVRQVDTSALAAWRDGWLVFDNTPLAEALASVNSYRARPIVTASPRIDAMRLSGRFRCNDSAGLLAALPSILPLAVLPRPDGSVELQAR